MNARKAISKGIVAVMNDSPFYTTIILKHEIVENPQLPAIMGTDGKNLMFNPNLVDQISETDIREILKHEAMHVAYQHHIRLVELRKSYGPRCKEMGIDMHETFNIAADLAINSLLLEHQEDTWRNSEILMAGCIPGYGKFRLFETNQSAEAYFKELLDTFDDLPQSLQQAMQETGGGAGDQGEGESERQFTEITDIEGADFGKVYESPEKDMQKAQQEAIKMIASASVASKAAGRECRTAQALITGHEAPAALNWRVELQNFMAQYTRSRPHYRKPNRRFQDSNIIFPCNKDREDRTIVLLLDVSGSMSDQAVTTVFDHISDIIRAKPGTKIHLVPFDAQVFKDSIKIFDASNVPIKDMDRKRAGYGGTLFMPAVKYAEGLNPSGIIMLTDLIPCDSYAFTKWKPKVPCLVLSVYRTCFAPHLPANTPIDQIGGVRPKQLRIIEVEV